LDSACVFVIPRSGYAWNSPSFFRKSNSFFALCNYENRGLLINTNGSGKDQKKSKLSFEITLQSGSSTSSLVIIWSLNP
jgi:hypothetical protein